MTKGSKHDVKARTPQRFKSSDTENMDMSPARAKGSLFNEVLQKKVCAYYRVSTDGPRRTSSYEIKKHHYEEFIKDHPGWALVDIYADDGSAGSKSEGRNEFSRMIADCQRGKIDLIICKSIACFSRNIVDCIQTVRLLLDMKPPVGVIFEEERMSILDIANERTINPF